ncbi:MAG: hypothetical protein QOF58_832 [Pseudonocardiales bacterium]|nr:hypothetical protein [Pseudonocardiales bacterium]
MRRVRWRLRRRMASVLVLPSARLRATYHARRDAPPPMPPLRVSIPCYAETLESIQAEMPAPGGAAARPRAAGRLGRRREERDPGQGRVGHDGGADPGRVARSHRRGRAFPEARAALLRRSGRAATGRPGPRLHSIRPGCSSRRVRVELAVQSFPSRRTRRSRATASSKPSAPLQADDQVADLGGLGEEWVVAGVEFHDAGCSAGELALPVGRGAPVLRADEVRRGHALPGR